MCWSKNGGVRKLVWKFAAGFSLLLCLAAAGCADDPWRDVPEFETLQFECPVPGGKFLDDANFVCSWSLLGPLAQTPGEGSRLHTEHVAEEALLNGNRRAPRGSSWRRISVRNAVEDGFFAWGAVRVLPHTVSAGTASITAFSGSRETTFIWPSYPS